MSQTAVALFTLAALVSAVQWGWTRLASGIDLFVLPAHSRRRVHWLLANSTHIQYAVGAVVATAIAVQAAALVG